MAEEKNKPPARIASATSLPRSLWVALSRLLDASFSDSKPKSGVIETSACCKADVRKRRGGKTRRRARCSSVVAGGLSPISSRFFFERFHPSRPLFSLTVHFFLLTSIKNTCRRKTSFVKAQQKRPGWHGTSGMRRQILFFYSSFLLGSASESRSALSLSS